MYCESDSEFEGSDFNNTTFSDHYSCPSWEIYELCSYTEEPYYCSSFNTKHYPEVKSCWVNGDLQGREPNPLEPDGFPLEFRDPLDLGFDFEDRDMFEDDGLQVISDYDHQDFSINTSALSPPHFQQEATNRVGH